MTTRDPYRYFRVEARDLVEQLGRGVLDLEKGRAGPDLVSKLLRYAHTLKGAARVVKETAIADQAHALEDALAPFRTDAAAVPRALTESLLRSLDEIAARVAALAPSPAAGTPPVATGSPEVEEALRVVRADAADVDALVDELIETGSGLAGLRHSADTAERVRHLADLIAQNVARPRPGARDLGGRAGALAEELRDAAIGLERGLAAGIDRLDREIRQARESAERLRLVPAGTVFAAIERTARDAAGALDRAVDFSARGSDVRLEGYVLTHVQNALVQLVRNAVAHGIEPSAERIAAWKPPSGRISIVVERRGRRVRFSCQDDGRGFDVAALRRAAERRGLLSPEAPDPGLDALVGMLLRGGFSTASSVTGVSGRGVGLDVVRETVARLSGEVKIASRPGAGTTVDLFVPVSRSAMQALFVVAGGTAVVIPLDAVRGTLRLAPDDLTRTTDGDFVVHEGELIPYLPLGPALGGPGPHGRKATTAVVVAGGNTRAAIGVDRLLGTSSVVLRALPRLASVSPLLAGASLDAEGNPQLVVDPDGLVEAACRPGRGPLPSPEVPRVAVLVVDDSLTTRMLEQSILESAGYEVDLATSGEEGLEMARKRRYGVFLVDVEMPGMDGYAFVEKMRADPSTRDTPSILVTSRDTPEDRQRGKEAGAVVYIAKGEFDQAEFLEGIRRLVGGR